jgi:hypothetical protein
LLEPVHELADRPPRHPKSSGKVRRPHALSELGEEAGVADPQVLGAHLRDDAVVDRFRDAALDRAHAVDEEAAGARRVWVA